MPDVFKNSQIVEFIEIRKKRMQGRLLEQARNNRLQDPSHPLP
jgi:hypothetical protein